HPQWVPPLSTRRAARTERSDERDELVEGEEPVDRGPRMTRRPARHDPDRVWPRRGPYGAEQGGAVLSCPRVLVDRRHLDPVGGYVSGAVGEARRADPGDPLPGEREARERTALARVLIGAQPVVGRDPHPPRAHTGRSILRSARREHGPGGPVAREAVRVRCVHAELVRGA